ncbi:hypothetical protein IGI42_001666 [Enterococcus sp. AZ109]
MELFSSWKKEQKELQKICDVKRGSDGIIFYNVGRKTLYKNRPINSKMEELLDGKFTLHAFRHTLITFLEEAGCNSKKLSMYVGHDIKDKTVTANYAHLSSEYLKDIVELIAEIITPFIKIGV